MVDRPEFGSSSQQRVLIGAGIAAAAAGAAFLWGRRTKNEGDYEVMSDAPPHVLRGRAKASLSSDETLVGRTVTIGRPRQEIYDAWRNFTRFPDFMENVTQVRDLGDNRSRWQIKAPGGGEVELVTKIVEDVPGERIAWESEA